MLQNSLNTSFGSKLRASSVPSILINQNFNEEGRKAGTELAADLFPAFLLSLFKPSDSRCRRGPKESNLLGEAPELRSFDEF
jgi:hypothetical protein